MRKLPDVRSGATGKSLQAADRNVSSWMPVCENFPGYLPYDGSVCENIVIKDNTFEDVFAGIGSHSMMFDKPYKNITISNNRFNNLKKRAIWCLNYQDTVVTGNTMTNVGGGVYVRSVYTRNAHTVSGQEVSPEGNQYAENILIADNQITVLEPTVIDGKQWNGYGIWITGEVSLLCRRNYSF